VRAGHPCPHSTGSGCAIYANRPAHPCRNFVCGWVRDDSPLPEWMRPDQCGAVIFLWFEWRGQKVINAVPVGQSVPGRTLEWLKRYAQEQGRPLIFIERIEENGEFLGERSIGFGPPGFRDEVREMQIENRQSELLDMYRSLPGRVRDS